MANFGDNLSDTMAIRVLDPQVMAQIAAGEVVERPASVVKELVENSLDAGASRLTIEIEGGGVDLIRVSDDGEGIAPDEIELAFSRHATSKIRDLTDLERVPTLGFRGEALPSIAGISRVTLASRPANSTVGQEISLRWGAVVKTGPTGVPTGTTVSVSDLFGNVPARRKFLRSSSAEAARIGDLVTRMALACPDVAFRLKVDGRNSLSTPGHGSLIDTISAVYSVEVAQGLLEASFELEEEGYSASGFVAGPSVHRANRTYITFFVNRRWIQSRLLSYALEEAYQGFLPQKRYPVAVLNLAVPPQELDVNVHPAKREVRFRQENRAFSVVQRAVRSALVTDSPIPIMSLPGEQSFAGPASAYQSYLTASPFTHGPSTTTGGPEGGGPRIKLPYLRIMGQIQNTYVVAEGPDGLYLLDQHAAHERVVFERIRRESQKRSGQAQPLLEPEPVDLTAAQQEILRESEGELQQYGFLFEAFGERSYLLRAVPAVASRTDPSTALLEVLDLLSSQGGLTEQDQGVAASIACHSAIRAGKTLTVQEMEELARQLEETPNPHTCPHGRPTMIHLSAHHLEREFGRR